MNRSDFDKALDLTYSLVARSRILREQADELGRRQSSLEYSLDEAVRRLQELEYTLDDLMREAMGLRQS